MAGSYNTGTSTLLTSAEAWNGSSWSIQSTPSPAGAADSQLNGVSCRAANACLAVGSQTSSSGIQVTLAERWNGTNWSIQSTPSLAGAAGSQLNGVSCASATACTAVGSYTNSTGDHLTLAESWNGTSWRIQSTPSRGGTLNGVSCTFPSACVAVGSFANATLAVRWNGSRWSIQSTPSRGGTLNGVSCTSATACTAVGFDSTQGDTLAEAWNGSSWTIQHTPNEPGSMLTGVSCTSATACTTVGYAPFSFTLAERWNGVRWSIQSTPSPPEGPDFIQFNGVSCISATACTAVGSYSFNTETGEIGTMLVERWNGSDWSIQSTPNPPGYSSAAGRISLNGVACASAAACTAVGSHTALLPTGFPGESEIISAPFAERYS